MNTNRCKIFVLVGLIMMTSKFATAEPLPPGGVPLLADDAIPSLKPVGNQAQLAKTEPIDVQDQLFKRALRISVAGGAKSEWNVQLVSPVRADIAKGDVVLVHFWMRCIESMTGDGQIGIVIEQNHAPNDKIVDRHIATAAKWQECFVPFRSSRDFKQTETQFCLRLGFDRQTIELADVQILNFKTGAKLEDLPRTRMNYIGREKDAVWRKEALARIDKIRKGDLQISVVDAGGKPVADAKVHIQLKRHQFGFGSCVTAELLTGQSEDAKRYRDIVEKYFNLAVFENDMKWPAVWDGIPPTVDQALAWLLERKIEVRGHNLVWPSWKWAPPQLKQYEADPAKLREVISKHITDVTSHFKGKLTQWDVVNEPFTNRELIDPLGGDAVMIDWFKLAHEADPACTLFLNDFGILEGGAGNEHRDHFYNTIKFLKDNGAPINGIGIQSHFSSDLPSPMQLMSVFDRFAAFGFPIESTELSVNIEDADVQADYLRDYMIAAFSHPRVEGIMLWGFWEKRHWRPKAALFGGDWSVRPIGQTFIDLMEKEWTARADASTDAHGDATVRGFLGDYEITVTAAGKTQTQSASLSSNTAAKVRIEMK